MIANLLDIVSIILLIGIIPYILRGVKDEGDKLPEKPSNKDVKIAILLPVKNPPPTFKKLLESLNLYTYNADVYIAYQGEKPSIDTWEYQNIKLYIIEGGEEEHYRGKIGNLKRLLDNIELEMYDYIIFIDDDIIVHRNWLKTLTSLASKKGVSTGYRLYLPVKRSVGAILKSIWNLYTLDTIYSSRERIVWGGSACFRDDAIEKNELYKLWRGAVSDDVAFTYIARCKYDIGFNEKALVISLSSDGFKEAVDFIIRQQRIVYIYNKWLWLKGVLTHLLINILFILLITNVSLVVLNPYAITSYIKSLAITGIFTSYVYRNHFRLKRIKLQINGKYVEDFKRLLTYNMIFTPFFLIIQLYLLLLSIGRRINWRGTTYILPTEDELGYKECK